VAELKGPVTTFKAQYVPDWNDTDSTDTKVAAVRLLSSRRGAAAASELLMRLASNCALWRRTAISLAANCRRPCLRPPEPALLPCRLTPPVFLSFLYLCRSTP
jgi:hypothetical protein